MTRSDEKVRYLITIEKNIGLFGTRQMQKHNNPKALLNANMQISRYSIYDPLADLQSMAPDGAKQQKVRISQ